MAIYIGNKKPKLYLGNKKIKKVYLGMNKVYSSGNIVTYSVDSGTSYTVECDEGASVLSPTTFTPSKSGWTFVGWREDKTASSSVLTNKVMGDNDITLYAVFKKQIMLTLYNGSGTATTTSDYQYYNNETIANPTFTVAQTTISGWTARGWSTATTGNASANYSSLSNTAFSANTTLYGLYNTTITLKCVANGSTTNKTGTRYYNSAGNFVNPTFTVANPTSSGGTFLGWSTSSTSTTVSYSSISNRTFTANTTIYAVFKYADTTVSPTTSNFSLSNEWVSTGTLGTIYSSVDTGKYYAAKLSLGTATSNTQYYGTITQIFISDGTASTRIVYSEKDVNENEYNNLGQNLNPTLTFSSSSGTKAIYLTSVVSGNYTATIGSYGVMVNSIQLLARTVVG